MDYTYSTFYPNQALQESNATGNVEGTAPSQGGISVAPETTIPITPPIPPTQTNMADYGLDKYLSYTTPPKPGAAFPFGRPMLVKVWIDGTKQEGKNINDEGKMYVGFNVGVGAIYEDYPKDKGFVKGDEKGNYFYFEQLPDFKMMEIDRLVRLKKEKEDAEAKAKILAQKEAREKAQKAKEAFERARQEAKAKREAEEQAKRQAAELARQQEMQRLAAKQKTNRTMYIIIGVVAIGIIGFFVWRKMKK